MAETGGGTSVFGAVDRGFMATNHNASQLTATQRVGKVKSWRKLKALVRYNKIGTRSGFSRFKPCYIITRILGIAEKTIQGVVFNEVLTAAARDIVTKDILRMASAHTKESAKALADMIQITYPHARLAFVVAMANDKDPQAFAIELLAGRIL
ncbi:hypothetical protein E3N88_09734 [Mikania micrantha]|uniref:Uncharacterized protein n=1 Tax=Mikania micrantha TaxID=192012 RepID=A0A5N6PKR4_9ASTR|nr:hypothetical protein E3N88_09734 [Mikania micrantha]